MRTWACICGCVAPPMTPKLSQGCRSLVTNAGIIVWKGTLTWCIGIKTPGRKIEELSPILKDKPKARDSHPRTHAPVVTLNKRNHVAFSIGGGEVNGIAFVEVGIARLDAERGFVW